MKNFFVAGTDLVIETDNVTLNYNKGDFVDIRMTSDGSPFVVKHKVTTESGGEGEECMSPDGKKGRIKEVEGRKMCVIENTYHAEFKALNEKVVADLAVFEQIDTFNSFVGQLVMKTELDEAVELQSITVADLLVSEGLTVAAIARYMAESRDEKLDSPANLDEAVKAMTAIVDESSIKVPVYRRIKKESLTVKIAAIKENLSKPKAADNVTESLVTAVGYDADKSVDTTGYMLATETMKSAVSSFVSKPVVESVYKTTEGLDPTKAKFTETYTLEAKKHKEGDEVKTKKGGKGKFKSHKEDEMCEVVIDDKVQTLL